MAKILSDAEKWLLLIPQNNLREIIRRGKLVQITIGDRLLSKI